jgi:hypothetical protein
MSEAWPKLEHLVWSFDSRHIISSTELHESSCQKSLSPQQDFAGHLWLPVLISLSPGHGRKDLSEDPSTTGIRLSTGILNIV